MAESHVLSLIALVLLRHGAERLFAAIVTEHSEMIQAFTGYDLDAGQKKEYLTRRVRGE
jgi:hypothetical protein